ACATSRASSSCARSCSGSTRSSTSTFPRRQLRSGSRSRRSPAIPPTSPTARPQSPSAASAGPGATARRASPVASRTWPRWLRGRPRTAHARTARGGGGGSGPLAAAPGGLALEHDTMVAAYLIDPARRTYPLIELAADEGLAAERPPAEDEGQLALGDGEEPV